MIAPMDKAFLNAESIYVLKRFGLKLGLILIAASLQIWTPWGFSNALLSLTTISAVIAVGLATALGNRWRGTVLSYWDEAFAFATIALLAAFCWHAPPISATTNSTANPSSAAPVHQVRQA